MQPRTATGKCATPLDARAPQGSRERDSAKGEARPGEVTEHEHRSVEWRVVAPPTGPLGVVGPGPTMRGELVAPHDLGADVARVVAGEVIVEPAATTRFLATCPTRSSERPPHEVGRDVRRSATLHRCRRSAEWRIEALPLSGSEPVGREEEVLHTDQLRHVPIFARRSSGSSTTTTIGAESLGGDI